MKTVLPLGAAIILACLATPSFAFDPIVVLPGGGTAIQPNGNPALVLATKEQTGGQFGAIILSDAGAGGGPGPAIIQQTQTEIWFVLEGSYEFHIGDKVFTAGPGTFIAVDAGQPHGFITKSAGRLLTLYAPGGYEHFFMDWDKLGLKPGPDLGKLEKSYGATRPAS
jgi:mannose-6-phosphate isomerase-like protein (cupin superfamily)